MTTPPQPLRVLFLSAIMNRVGTWFRTFGLARGLARRGHDVTVVKVSPDRRIVPARTVESGVVVWEMPRFYGWRFSHRGSRLPVEIAARLALLATTRYDVAHS